MTKYGKKYNFGDIIITKVQFSDTFEIKKRPALVLFEEYGNVICAVITSNPYMRGIKLSKEEGLIADSVIKINYIFTVSERMIEKFLFKISNIKKETIKRELLTRLN
ncbi:MAG TPA: type II toxin-antitoxin system PemK/MazF family toxin [Candidatus Nanoarchaeia archaeon]|nr:type II toxin-antitoxin system PemK/MazF family toxin [Candidatus Nanoarchaeia archaeon]